MDDYTITPKVDAAREFLEIAGDFTNPLEVAREGISNSIDAGAKDITIEFSTEKEVGNRVLVIKLIDDGAGMTADELQSFFDLGNSAKRDKPQFIGEKGHGTKVFFNCQSILVTTFNGLQALRAEMLNPYAQLHEGRIPTVSVTKLQNDSAKRGTEICIRGFNNNQGELFTHDRLRDYITWFTKFGSFEQLLNISSNAQRKIRLKGLDKDEIEEIAFGHVFPVQSKNIHELFTEHVVRAPDFYCKQIIKSGSLKKHPDIKFQAVFSIEGNRVKQQYNRMLRRPGYQAPRGAYTVQDRYGLWLCKDFIPIERRNEWINVKGSEFTKLHAFFNCQDFSLTANRGSIANTPPEILDDIRNTVADIYDEITEGDDWREMEWLESESSAYVTQERERRDFQWRKQRANSSNIAKFKDVILVEPTRESGVYALIVQLAILDPDLFPFEIIDYDTYAGIDVLVKSRGTTSVGDSALYYVEFKWILERTMNHCFENMKAIVCWDTEIKHGEKVTDLSGEERTMFVIPPDKDANYKGYYLRRDRKTDIEVFVLKEYLRDIHGLEFRPRVASAIVL